MTLLEPLTYAEARELSMWLGGIVEQVEEEVTALARPGKATRDWLYGPDVLESFTAFRDEMRALAAEAVAEWWYKRSLVLA